MTNNSIKLFSIKLDAKCIKCGHLGAVHSYGTYYPNGLGGNVDSFGKFSRPIMEKYKESPYMSHSLGFGGIIPYECTNCGNIGLSDEGGLEGYDMAFTTVKNKDGDI